MRWLAVVWRRVAWAVRVRARLVSRLHSRRAENAALRHRLAELLVVADREQARLRLAHAEELAERQQIVAELRRALAGEQMRADAAEADKRSERRLANEAWQRLGRVGVVADDPGTPAWLAERIRALTSRVPDDGGWN